MEKQSTLHTYFPTKSGSPIQFATHCYTIFNKDVSPLFYTMSSSYIGKHNQFLKKYHKCIDLNTVYVKNLFQNLLVLLHLILVYCFTLLIITVLSIKLLNLKIL